MQTNLRKPFKISAALLLVLVLLASGLYRWNGKAAELPATPCTAIGTEVTCNLWATTGSVTMPNGTVVTIWGFAANSTDPASLPGPALIVNEGDHVTVNLVNNLTVDTAILFQGQQMVPDITGVAANGGMKTYEFTASSAGTYLYQASPLVGNSAYQSAMGMYGALVVHSATAGTAYGTAESAFDEEALLVFGEVDANLNNSPDPAAFDMRSFHPTFFLINGASYPDIANIDVNAGHTVLLRMVNAGVQSHSISTLGLAQNIVAQDGSAFNNARKLVADTMFPGQTSDVLVQTSALTSVGTKYAVYDSAFIFSNNTSSGFGGMLTFINLTSGTVIATDTVGPLTNSVTVTPDHVPGGMVTLDASISEALSCPVGATCTVEAAEYYIDSTTPGTGLAFPGAVFGSETVAVSAMIDADALTTGTHTIYVRGQDNSGNWGAFGSASLFVDHDGPSIIGAQIIPNPSNGSSVLLEASGDDRATGNSFVSAAEYFVSAPGADGTGTAMTLETFAATSYFTAPLSAGSTETLFVHVMDEMGNWGAFTSLDLVVDQSGPVTSNVVANPDTTNGIDQSVNSSIAAVRITADFSDGPASISAAEGFIDVIGLDGTGFLFIADDGLFDSLAESGYADIPLSEFWVLPAGTHTIYVHARDAAGNWGATSAVTITVTHP